LFERYKVLEQRWFEGKWPRARLVRLVAGLAELGLGEMPEARRPRFAAAIEAARAWADGGVNEAALREARRVALEGDFGSCDQFIAECAAVRACDAAVVLNFQLFQQDILPHYVLADPERRARAEALLVEAEASEYAVVSWSGARSGGMDAPATTVTSAATDAGQRVEAEFATKVCALVRAQRSQWDAVAGGADDPRRRDALLLAKADQYDRLLRSALGLFVSGDVAGAEQLFDQAMHVAFGWGLHGHLAQAGYEYARRRAAALGEEAWRLWDNLSPAEREHEAAGVEGRVLRGWERRDGAELTTGWVLASLERWAWPRGAEVTAWVVQRNEMGSPVITYRCPDHPLRDQSPEGPGSARPVVRVRFGGPAWIDYRSCEARGCERRVPLPPETERNLAYSPFWVVCVDGTPAFEDDFEPGANIGSPNRHRVPGHARTESCDVRCDNDAEHAGRPTLSVEEHNDLGRVGYEYARRRDAALGRVAWRSWYELSAAEQERERVRAAESVRRAYQRACAEAKRPLDVELWWALKHMGWAWPR
jgi:hypothetical protein